jgi:ABC-type xylose transport system permease subunit
VKQNVASGLDDFKLLLKEFRGLSVWAVGGSLVVPFAAALADLSPPWPAGIVPITAVAELLALVLVFQFFKNSKRRVTNRLLLLSVAIFAITMTVYLIAFSYFTYRVPTTKERFVKGYKCTINAEKVFKDRCPDLGLDELRTAGYEAERLWTSGSIALVRTGLALVWSLLFVALSFALGAFLQYQMRRKNRWKIRATRAKKA